MRTKLEIKIIEDNSPIFTLKGSVKQLPHLIKMIDFKIGIKEKTRDKIKGLW